MVGGYPEPQQSARYFSRSRDFLSIRTYEDFDNVYDFLLKDIVKNCQLVAEGTAIALIVMGISGLLTNEKVVDVTSSALQTVVHVAGEDNDRLKG